MSGGRKYYQRQLLEPLPQQQSPFRWAPIVLLLLSVAVLLWMTA